MPLSINLIKGNLREGEKIELEIDFTGDPISHLSTNKKWEVFSEKNISYNSVDDYYYYDDVYYGKVYEATDTDVIQLSPYSSGRLFCLFTYTNAFGVVLKVTKVFQILPKRELIFDDVIADGDTKKFYMNFDTISNVSTSWTFFDNNENIIGDEAERKFDKTGYYKFTVDLDYSNATYTSGTFINWESLPTDMIVGISGGIFGATDTTRDIPTVTEQISGNFLVTYDLNRQIDLDYEINTCYTEENEAPLVVTFEDKSDYGTFSFNSGDDRLEFIEIDFGDGEIVKKTSTGFQHEKIYKNSGTFRGKYIVHTYHLASGIEYRQVIEKPFSITVNPFFYRWAKDHTPEDLYKSQGFKDLMKSWGYQMDRLYNDAKGVIESIDIENIDNKFLKSFFNTYGDFEEIAEKIGFDAYAKNKTDIFNYFDDYNFFDRLEREDISKEEKIEFIDYVRDSLKRLQRKGTPKAVEDEIKRFKLMGYFVELWVTERKNSDIEKTDDIFLLGTRTNTGIAYRNVSTPLSDNINAPIGNNSNTPYIEINTVENTNTYYYTADTETRIINGSKYAVFKQPNKGIIQFLNSSYSVNESDKFVQVVLRRTGDMEREISVEYTTINGSANSINDYFYKTGKIIWGEGDSSDKIITIPLIDDDNFEDVEEFIVSIYNPSAGSIIGTKSTTKIEITSDDPIRNGIIQFSAFVYPSEESDGKVTVTVFRSSGHDGIVTIKYETIEGTALAGIDYIETTGTLVWQDGDYSEKTFDVVLINDSELEVGETIDLKLSNVTGGATIGNRDFATIIINPNDSPLSGIIEFSALSYIVDEDAGVINIPVKRINGSDKEVTIEYQTQNNTALAGTNYITSTGILLWQDGDATNKIISIPILDNNDFNLDVSFNVVIFNPTGGAEIGSNFKVPVSIKDDEQRNIGELNFRSSSYTVNETNGLVSIKVSRTGGSDGEITVQYYTTDITATAGTDYSPVNDTLIWFDNDTLDKEIIIPISDDLIYEDNETFKVTLANTTGGATIGSIGETIVTLVSDEVVSKGLVQFVSTEMFVTEKDAPIITIPVRRSIGFDTIATVNYTIIEGDAEAGTDFSVGSLTGTLTFPKFDTRDQVINIQILNDSIYELDEAFTIVLSDAIETSLGSNTTATVNIEDDENGEISLSSSTYSIAENSGSVIVTVKRTNGAQGIVTVDYTTTDNTALGGNDYTTTIGKLTWADGNSDDKQVTIPILNDSLFENNENFTFTISNPTGGATITSPSTAIVTISDDEYSNSNGFFKFESSLYTVDENDGQVEIVIQRTDGTNGNVTVDYATQNDTAIAGQDYISKTGTIGWTTGDSSNKSIFINIKDNNQWDSEEPRRFTVKLSNAGGGALIVIGETEVKIQENEIANYGNVQFMYPTYTVPESAGNVSIGVNRINGSEGSVSVDYSTSNSSATSPSDYMYISGTLSWGDGDSATKYFDVPILIDYLTETTESFQVSLSNEFNASLGIPNTTTVSVIDTPYREKQWYFDGIDNRVDSIIGLNPFDANKNGFLLATWINPLSVNDGGTLLKLSNLDNENDYLIEMSKSSIIIGGETIGSTAKEILINDVYSGGYNFTWVQDISGSINVYHGLTSGTLTSQGTDTYPRINNVSSTELIFGSNFNTVTYSDYAEAYYSWIAYWDLESLTESQVNTLRNEVYNSGDMKVDLFSVSIPPTAWYRFGNGITDDNENSSNGLLDNIGTAHGDPKNFTNSQETFI